MTVTAMEVLANQARAPVRVNDVHSKLNSTVVTDYRRVSCVADLLQGLRHASDVGLPVAVCGGGHAMGGQQFASRGMLLDMNGMNRVLNFDSATGLIEVEAGIQWPKLLESYLSLQAGSRQQWGIRQKQTGADRMSIGGALAANIHGRVLTNGPIIEDVRSFRLLGPDGVLHECSREHNADLFALVIGGYGLFGIILSVTMQLVPRQKLSRIVEVTDLNDLPDAFASRISDGYAYGDWQFRIDDASPRFLQEGIFSCYRPVPIDTPIPETQIYMTESGWQDLLYLAHTEKSRAFEEFSRFYLSTSGQVYWSDAHQFTTYLDDYHTELDRRLCRARVGSEMISELYVPLSALPSFMDEAASVLRSAQADLIYGTVRLIRKDEESFLAWAKEDWACVIFNLHVEHNPQGIANNRLIFKRLIDAALRQTGSFFLTYHRYASKAQVEQAYPQFARFLAEKQARDPRDRFCSDWYRHYTQLF